MQIINWWISDKFLYTKPLILFNMSEEETDGNDLDPRIQIELEKLNTTTDEINKLEIEYDVSALNP